MPGRIFVDTSFVLALLNEWDQHHAQAISLSHQFETSRLIITDAVLLEIGNALAKDFRMEAIEIIKVFRTSDRVEVVEISKRLFEQGLELYEQYADKTWGLVDCLSFTIMRESGVMEALTFDGDFAQAGFALLKN